MSRWRGGVLLVGAWAVACPGERAADDRRPDIADYLITPPGTESWRPGQMLALRPAYPRLSLTDPVAVAHPDREDGHIYVVEGGGRVLRFVDNPSIDRATTVLDLSAEVASAGAGAGAGLRAVAFHPRYPDDPRLFSYRVAPIDGRRLGIIASHRLRPGGAAGPPVELLRLDVGMSAAHPSLAFSAAGVLLATVGGAAGAAGDRSSPGAVLRVGFDHGGEDAPAAKGASPLGTGHRATFAGGLHAPGGLSRDRRTGRLWLVDRGARAWDEVNEVVAGADYGWPIREGDACVGTSACESRGLSAPVAVHRRGATRAGSGGSSGGTGGGTGGGIGGVIGGFVYRGRDAPALVGSYLYAEVGNGSIFAVDVTNPRRAPQPRRVVETQLQITVLGEDRRGELLAIDGQTRKIYRLGAHPLEPSTPGGAQP